MKEHSDRRVHPRQPAEHLVFVGLGKHKQQVPVALPRQGVAEHLIHRAHLLVATGHHNQALVVGGDEPHRPSGQAWPRLESRHRSA